jgi:DNA polymerase III epsilon subunit-like protein
MASTSGIVDRCIHESPIAVVDFETTGLTPGFDRVIEVSVVRLDPGKEARLVLDTLVNPMRPVAATEIHGITDADVAKAPRFHEIAGEFAPLPHTTCISISSSSRTNSNRLALITNHRIFA